MTIVSHEFEFIFLKSMKTGGSSVEAALLPYLGRRDWLALTPELEPLDHPFWRTSNNSRLPIPRERRIKSRLGLHPSWKLRKHSSAAHVREVVGETVWDRYLKFSIERDPWDRMVSLWRWRARARPDLPFEEFLHGLESGRDDEGVRGGASSWSNWPIYAVGDEIVADRVIEYADLEAGLAEVLEAVGAPTVELPRLKSHTRSPGLTPGRVLTVQQVERIGVLHRREIEAFGYRAPSVDA
jgi:hypothetical protein